MTLHELYAPGAHRWTQNASARNAAGVPTNAAAPDATCYCLYGALVKCYGGNDAIHAYDDKLQKVLTRSGRFVQYVTWNDNRDRTFAEIQELVKEANI